MRRMIMALAALGFAWSAATAHAQDTCGTEQYDHNGSAMDVTVCRGEMTITYARPRPGLRKAGVAPGTVLFRGRFQPGRPGEEATPLAGTAYVFRGGCPPAGYPVEGQHHAEIILWGKAPVRDSGCLVTGYRDDTLRFN
ncbi:hypothetical protein [Acuticoccus sediminis]|uniref:hypothetical protein n=1 Tax=Acuticoccus sediminis TaxID=2184697 RepID=UPI001CFE819F|nr:hypothetical protein [Acuticoccus sediminis]